METTGTDYAQIDLMGAVFWIPMRFAEEFLNAKPMAVLSDIIRADRVKQQYDVLTPHDVQLLQDAGVAVPELRNIPWTADDLERMGAVILVKKA